MWRSTTAIYPSIILLNLAVPGGWYGYIFLTETGYWPTLFVSLLFVSLPQLFITLILLLIAYLIWLRTKTRTSWLFTSALFHSLWITILITLISLKLCTRGLSLEGQLMLMG